MLFGREVFLTRDSNELNRVTGKLIENGIEYNTKTNNITNPGRSHGVPFINAAYSYEYRVRVRKVDLERARYVISK